MMNYLKRVIYLLYYLKKMDMKVFLKFFKWAKERSGKSGIFLIFDNFRSVFLYNISILEYYQFKFFLKPHELRSTYAGTGFMYEYQLRMNPKKTRNILEDKIQFLNFYKNFVRREYVQFNSKEILTDKVEELLRNPSGKIVIKNSHGGSGIGIKVLRTAKLSKDDLMRELEVTKNDLAEEFVIQHDDIMKLSPSGLNTIRIITQVSDGSIEIIGCRLRISVNSEVDNMAAGNLVASINSETGIVESCAVYSDITKKETEIHPITNMAIKGFKIPFWDDTITMVKAAALLGKQNRSVGWDVAISNEGPELIEGNHDWCKLVWQLPVEKGLKQVLQPYQNL